METTTIKVSGMTCMGCVNSVKKVLTAVNGVRAVDVSLDQGRATVDYDPAVAAPAQFKSAIETAGFTAS
jgi:copper chaperone